MPYSSLMARALACAALAAGAAGAAPQSVPDAADPRAPVPPTVYQPAIGYQVAPPPADTPDRGWRASNEAVTRKPALAMPAQPAQPAPSPQPGQPMPHMDHMEHMEHMDHAHGAAHRHGEAP